MNEPSFKSLLAATGIKPSKLAEEVRVHKSRISRWASSRVPSERVLDVERITGISRHALRPDVFGPAPKQTEAA
jgi:DNA-binding transcriptional regulator YdaS (Cro superfamily)